MSVVAKARGMTELARETGLAREQLPTLKIEDLFGGHPCTEI